MRRRVGPASVSWRIDRENVLLFGGRRALLLQLAHPLVAQGVADHSNFRRDRFGRLLRTVDLSLTIMFGNEDEARLAIDQIKAVHRVVEGTLDEDVGSFSKGTRYRAGDPNLLLWVHATLVETAIYFYDRFVEPMSDSDAERYYTETLWPAVEIGIPQTLLPQSFGEFRRYWHSMLEGGEIAVGNAGMQLSREILYPASPVFPRRLLDPLNLITIGTLPEPVRRMYGLRWNAARTAALQALTLAVPRAIRLLPARLRFVPHVFEAERRSDEVATAR